MSKKKRLISLMLVMVMVITIFPFSVSFGEETQTGDVTQQNEITAEGTEVADSQIDENGVIDNSQTDKTNDEASSEVIENKTDDKQTADVDNQKNEQSTDKDKTVEKTEKEKYVDWPQAPSWMDKSIKEWKKPDVKNGKVVEKVYGESTEKMTEDKLETVKEASSVAKTPKMTKGHEITEKALDFNVAVYINGKLYQGGDITVQKKDNFAYSVTWAP